MSCSTDVQVQEHKTMHFHESGYVFVRVLGAGRHGTMKLAKKKSNSYVKQGKACCSFIVEQTISFSVDQ